MGWFSKNKPKVTTTKLKNGTLTKDPFKNSILYVTQKNFKFIRSKGMLSPFKCTFNVIVMYNKTPEAEFWGIEFKTYRKLKASNLDKMEKLIKAEPMWREMEDFIVMVDGQRLKSETISFDSEKNTTSTTRESWSGGRAQFLLEDFEEIAKASTLDMRYYGLNTDSQFDLEHNEVLSIKGLVTAALADIDDIAPNSQITYNTSAKPLSETPVVEDNKNESGDDDLEPQLARWLNNASDHEPFIIYYSEKANVYLQGYKSGSTIHIETTSKKHTDTLSDDGVSKLQELGWSLSKDENYIQDISVKEFQTNKVVSLVSETFNCYSVSPLLIKIKFELV